jgi:heterodisulfide reductase subunit A
MVFFPLLWVENRQMSGTGPIANSGKARIGVFVCHCGSNIAGLLDCEALAEYAAALPNVVYAKDNLYTCSESGIAQIQAAIREHDLTRVVVASWSPRTHQALFKSACAQAGLNPYLFEMANIRDQCSWVHMQERDAARLKAMDLIRMAVAKAALLEPLEDIESSLVRKALVLGGGVAGMSAASALAGMGVEVLLVEREAELGGLVRRLYRVGPSNEAAADLLAELLEQVRSAPAVRTFLATELAGVTGVVGNYEISLKSKEGEETKETVGSIIVATGAMPLKPEGMFGYDSQKVITQIELEERLQTGSVPEARNIVMIQCIGARCPQRTYCSRICCLTAVKNALLIKALNPDARVHILYRDIQMYGAENEKLLWESRGAGVRFDIYDPEVPPVVKEQTVTFHQPLTGMTMETPCDLVVLSTPLTAPRGAAATANLMRIPVDENKFFMEAHAKLRPLDFATDGIFLAGTARFAATVREAVAQGLGAASRANTILSKDRLVFSALVSRVTDRCDGCGLCLDVCPYHAITLEEHEQGGRVLRNVRTDPVLCKGCGVCEATCPKRGIVVDGFTPSQIKAQVDALLEALPGEPAV